MSIFQEFNKVKWSTTLTLITKLIQNHVSPLRCQIQPFSLWRNAYSRLLAKQLFAPFDFVR